MWNVALEKKKIVWVFMSPILKKTSLREFILFYFILFDFAPTNVGQGGHNSITNYCGPKNKY